MIAAKKQKQSFTIIYFHLDPQYSLSFSCGSELLRDIVCSASKHSKDQIWTKQWKRVRALSISTGTKIDKSTSRFPTALTWKRRLMYLKVVKYRSGRLATFWKLSNSQWKWAHGALSVRSMNYFMAAYQFEHATEFPNLDLRRFHSNECIFQAEIQGAINRASLSLPISIQFT